MPTRKEKMWQKEQWRLTVQYSLAEVEIYFVPDVDGNRSYRAKPLFVVRKAVADFVPDVDGNRSVVAAKLCTRWETVAVAVWSRIGGKKGWTLYQMPMPAWMNKRLIWEEIKGNFNNTVETWDADHAWYETRGELVRALDCLLAKKVGGVWKNLELKKHPWFDRSCPNVPGSGKV